MLVEATELIEIIEGKCGYGNLAVNKLGFACRETADQIIVLAPVEYDLALSAHAPSDVCVRLTQPARVAAATNASFHAAKPAEAWIGWHMIGILSRSSQVTPFIELPPGEYRLRIECETTNGAHTVWLFSRSAMPTEGRLAVITVACYKRNEIAQRCRPLFESAARRGLHVFVDGAEKDWQGLSMAKVGWLREFVRQLPRSCDWVAFTDGCDSFVVQTEDQILKSMEWIPDRNVLVSAEDNSWPVRDDDWTERFVKDFGFAPCPRGRFILPDGKAVHPFINSGGWGGRRSDVTETLDRLYELFMEMRGGKWPEIAKGRGALPRNDQFLWQVAYLTRRIDVIIDREWRVFACIGMSWRYPTENPFFTVKCDNGQVIFESGGGWRPGFIHMQGPAKPFLRLFDGLIGDRNVKE